MKGCATFAFFSIIVATPVLAQSRQVSLVKGAPTNYGNYGFDIS